MITQIPLPQRQVTLDGFWQSSSKINNMYKTEKRTIILIRNVVPFSEIAHKKIEPYFSIVYEVLYMVAIQGVYENGHIQ